MRAKTELAFMSQIVAPLLHERNYSKMLAEQKLQGGASGRKLEGGQGHAKAIYVVGTL